MSATLELVGLRHTFPAPDAPEGRVVAVDGIDLKIEQGRFFALLGPSGCGKTTTLRCIAGLTDPDAGRITIAGRVVYDPATATRVPAHRRRLGMVFQSYAIWPHLDVHDNVALPLQVGPRRHRPGRREIRERVERALSLVQLDDLLSRPATDLSGGQQQRLALARALVMQPPLLLLDEPLSNLDAQLREDLRFELKRLQREVGITTVLVTHDQLEALTLSNRMAVMADGRIMQVGRPRDLYRHPASRFVARFLGSSNLLEGELLPSGTGRGPVVRTAAGDLEIGGPDAGAAVSDSDQPVTVLVRPEHLRLVPGPPSTPAPNRWPGCVRVRAFRGDAMEHQVEVRGQVLRVRGGPELSLAPDTEVTVVLPAEHCRALPATP